MKKIIGIVIASLLFCSNAFSGGKIFTTPYELLEQGYELKFVNNMRYGYKGWENDREGFVNAYTFVKGSNVVTCFDIEETECYSLAGFNAEK